MCMPGSRILLAPAFSRGILRLAKSSGASGLGMNMDDLLLDAVKVEGSVDAFNPETDPARLIERVDRKGNPVAGPVLPKELLNKHYTTNCDMFSIYATFKASDAAKKSGQDADGLKAMEYYRQKGAFKEKNQWYRWKPLPFDAAKREQLRNEAKKVAQAKLDAIRVNGKLQIKVLMTGAAGFIGQEFCKMVAADDEVAEVHCILWAQEWKGIKGGMEEFRTKYLQRLDIPEAKWGKYHFVEGNVEKPLLDLKPEQIAEYGKKITHFAHLAASVSFEEPYTVLYSKNVYATQQSIAVSLMLQESAGSPFVNMLNTETCYIHGRNRGLSKESEVVFPEDYYNNYYELTKAMADQDAQVALLTKGLRVIACCPAIVIGHSRHGNNHGDRKVINAAVNAFGRVYTELGKLPFPVKQIASWLVLAFPGTRSVNMNLSPVDRISEGLVAALRKPQATGERIHLGCGGINTGVLTNAFHEEIGIKVKFVNPVMHQRVRRPALNLVFSAIGMKTLYKRLELLFEIFGGYSEWGQPNHELGNDVRLLGLSQPRPDLTKLTRMMCRHNLKVQGWGVVRDRDELAKREKLWAKFIEGLEKQTGKHAADVPPAEFEALFKKEVKF